VSARGIMFLKRDKKSWLRRRKLSMVSMFSASNIFIYFGLLSFGGYFLYQFFILHKSSNDQVDITIPFVIMCVFMMLSGLAMIKDQRTVDGQHTRVIRGKEAVRAGVEMIVFGIIMVILFLWGT
jgi:TRAP-type C4-dicarboxylate transport system permease small subunit